MGSRVVQPYNPGPEHTPRFVSSGIACSHSHPWPAVGWGGGWLAWLARDGGTRESGLPPSRSCLETDVEDGFGCRLPSYDRSILPPLVLPSASCPSLGDVATILRPVLRETRNPAGPRWKIRKLGRNRLQRPPFPMGPGAFWNGSAVGWARLDCCAVAVKQPRGPARFRARWVI